jgi:beta-lysine N6-acetyltransferase
MIDQITDLDGSIVHHGAANDRAYLMKLGGDPVVAAGRLEQLARRKGYSKIIAKVPARAQHPFAAAGYKLEGAVPGYFRGKEAAFFMVKYLDAFRRRAARPKQVAEVLDVARRRRPQPRPQAAEGCRRARPQDAEAMAKLYRQVFASYPFPIHDPDYLRQTMEENVVYFGFWDNGRPVALASAEMDRAAASAEMTDFATHPDSRGGGLATRLLAAMENEMGRQQVATLYTIARAVSFGMNLTFAKLGYRYGGTLTRNTQISGDLECMNIWFKGLAPPSSDRTN